MNANFMITVDIIHLLTQVEFDLNKNSSKRGQMEY